MFLCAQVQRADRDPETWRARCYSVPQGSRIYWCPCFGQEQTCLSLHTERCSTTPRFDLTHISVSRSEALYSHCSLTILLRWCFLMWCLVRTCSTTLPSRPHLQECTVLRFFHYNLFLRALPPPPEKTIHFCGSSHSVLVKFINYSGIKTVYSCNVRTFQTCPYDLQISGAQHILVILYVMLALAVLL